MTVVLTGYIDVPLERLEAVEAALQDHLRLTRAEPGCLSFHVTANPDTAGRFDVKETFVDQAAFDHHQMRTKASPWAETTKGMKRNYSIETSAP